ncbi:MAG TPA: UDP-N-acetylmuramoyl-tripeptide--D-alanyl-D-alanine ligase [Cyanobacteria bacterium UBA8530]|nr:UDP-N-acetylmuramoyl-tripeptide--D-alanyl-D-alanine ligase [Cyanobacteria bacterium UBA8530]
MFTLDEIAGIVGGELTGDGKIQVGGVSTDTRTIAKEELYLALKGENFDGHDFIERVEGRNPVLHQEKEVSAPSILVRDTLVAYGQLARAKRMNWGGKLVAVTGSSGKTSTKEAISQLLQQYAPTHRTEANQNNEIGLPKTLLSLGDQKYAVVEMGMRAKGEILSLAKIALPDIGLITNVGKAHIGRLGSMEAIRDAKGELFEEVERLGGIKIANGDDPLCRELIEKFPNRKILFGFGENCTLRGEKLDAQTFRVKDCLVSTSLPGEHHCLNALAAIAVGLALDLPLPRELAFNPGSLPGRAQRISRGKTTLWDESYNANPDSMRAAIKSLFEQPGKKFLVLGEMGELGEHAEREHLGLGEFLSAFPVDLLVTVGPLADLYGKKAGCLHENVPNRQEAAEKVLERISENAGPSQVLFKGSRSTKMEEVLSMVLSTFESAPS